MGYILVDNKSYDVTGVYYGGQNKKYSDVFNITTRKNAEIFDKKKQWKS